MTVGGWAEFLRNTKEELKEKADVEWDYMEKLKEKEGKEEND